MDNKTKFTFGKAITSAKIIKVEGAHAFGEPLDIHLSSIHASSVFHEELERLWDDEAIVDGSTIWQWECSATGSVYASLSSKNWELIINLF